MDPIVFTEHAACWPCQELLAAALRRLEASGDATCALRELDAGQELHRAVVHRDMDALLRWWSRP